MEIARPAGNNLKYRPDIDGLRAIAVTSVVLYHAFPRLIPSGFVGVDVFFVISGYLIGAIIYKAALNRTFSVYEFYARRARRILPALIAVVTFVNFVSLGFFDQKEALELAGQSALSLVGASNFYFWEHTGYFATESDVEPLLMTWSLGIEEQFYVLFPILIIAISRTRFAIRLAVVLLTIALSLLCSVLLTSSDPISAFYLLPARAWELGAGAVLAIVRHHYPQGHDTRPWRGELIGTACATAFVASLFVFDTNTPFPGLAALLPVLATVGLIDAQNSTFNRRVLSTPPFMFIGRISYSWYLWHWPLMALLRRSADYPPTSHAMAFVTVVSLVLAVLSWRFVEQPFRAAKRPAKQTLLRYGVALAAALVMPVLFKATGGLPQRLPDEVLVAERIRMDGRGKCLAPFGQVSLIENADCLPSRPAVALVGDSHASAFGPGLVKSAKSYGYDVAQFSKSSCSPLPGLAQSDPKRPTHGDECAAFLDAAITRITQSPDIRFVFVAAFWNANGGEQGAADIDAKRMASIANGLRTMHDRLNQAGKRMIVVGDVPMLRFDPMEHVIGEALSLRAALGEWSDGSRRPTNSTFSVAQEDRNFQAMREFLMSVSHEIGAEFFDPAAQICVEERCKFTVGTKPIYIDRHHLSSFGSRRINWDGVLAKLPRRASDS